MNNVYMCLIDNSNTTKIETGLLHGGKTRGSCLIDNSNTTKIETRRINPPKSSKNHSLIDNSNTTKIET